MKCVIFGGGGFLGAAISDRLLLDGHELRIFEKSSIHKYRQFEPNEKIEWMTGDILNKNDINNAIDGYDVVVHLISTTLPKSSNEDPIYDIQSNLISSINLLDSMVKKEVNKIIFISSGGTIYGRPKYLPIDEKHPTDPMVSYGIVKLAIEKYILMYNHLYNLNGTILRVSNPYGEHQRIGGGQGAVGVFVNDAINHKTIKIWGDGKVKRDYIYVKDVAEAFAKAITYSGQQRIFNISSGYGTSINELIKKIEYVIGYEIDREYLPGRPFDVPTSILSNELAKNCLEWMPTVTLDEGLYRTTHWIQSFSSV